MSASCVAMTTVVPERLIRSSRWTMSRLILGSRFPVGSSHRRICGLLTTARAMATRCCSPPESWCGRRLPLPSSPTISRVSGTSWRIAEVGLPMTCSANATFWSTVLPGRRRKSWKTAPIPRRKRGTLRADRVPRSRPATRTVPAVAFSSRRASRSIVDLPDPEGPTTKTNSPRSTLTFTSVSAGRVDLG
ncbi:hypothetical protein JNB_06589 [Janibacter sp. HTCC2649]|nr:hypothetical protein JNB_06589 [Janibacter sp. HTCC2649]